MASKMVPPKAPAPAKAAPEFTRRRLPMTNAEKAAVNATAKAERPVPAPAPKAAKAPSEKLAIQPATGGRPAMKMTKAGLPDKRVVPNKEKAVVRQGTSVGKQSTAASAYKRGGERGMPKAMKAPAGARPPIPVPTVKDKMMGGRRPDLRSTEDRRFILKGQGKEAYKAAKAAREAAMKAAARKAALKTAGKVAGRGLGVLGAAAVIPEVMDMVKQDRANVKAVLDRRRAANVAAMKKASAPAPAKPKTALQKSQDKFMNEYVAKAKGGKTVSGAEAIAMSQLAKARSEGGKFVGPKIVGPRKK